MKELIQDARNLDSAIVFVTPTLNGGGAERVAVELSRYFVSRGRSFTFLLTKQADTDYQIPAGVGVIRPSVGQRTGPLQQAKAIRSMMKEDPSRVFISFLADQNVLTLFAGIGLPNRVFVSVRNIPEADLGGSRPLQFLRDLLYRRSAGVVFQTREQMGHFPRAIAECGTTIPNPLRDDLPQPWRGARRNVVATSGRLVPQKNHPMTIEAFSRFLVKHPGFRLEVYGKGPLEQELRSFAAKLGVADSVDFFGFCDDATKRICSASAYVMSSDFEGLSNSMIESLAMGVPTACTRCAGGGAEQTIVDGVNGLLVDRGDVAGMADAMARLVDDEETSAALSVRALSLRDSLSLDAIGSMWAELMFGGDK